jgi:hypothetical protein
MRGTKKGESVSPKPLFLFHVSPKPLSSGNFGKKAAFGLPFPCNTNAGGKGVGN